ncbi:hypothetical protein KKG22_02900 [Patescibacteria group bacterium]|nr:hypothetical protein [Patescibacteria group bacterium]MBU1721470.1 hypothetical protein [Patescibacteria group bacterium]MBU1900773.1 hypothetical protein [Patescibacteria group bacterium]
MFSSNVAIAADPMALLISEDQKKPANFEEYFLEFNARMRRHKGLFIRLMKDAAAQKSEVPTLATFRKGNAWDPFFERLLVSLASKMYGVEHHFTPQVLRADPELLRSYLEQGAAQFVDHQFSHLSAGDRYELINQLVAMTMNTIS